MMSAFSNIRFDSFDNFKNKDRFLHKMRSDPSGSISHISTILAYFRTGERCDWRSQQLRDIIKGSEVALLLTKAYSLEMSTMDSETKELFTNQLIEFRDFCTAGIIKLAEPDSSKFYNQYKSELLKPYWDDIASELKVGGMDTRTDGNPWYLNDKPLVSKCIKRTLSVGSLSTDWEAFNSVKWSVVSINELHKRIAKYSDIIPMDTISDIRSLLTIFVWSVDFLGGRMAGALYATWKHPLTNCVSLYGDIVETILNSPNNHIPEAFITDGTNVNIYYKVAHPLKDKIEYYWGTMGGIVNINHGYRVFSVKRKKSSVQFLELDRIKAAEYRRLRQTPGISNISCLSLDVASATI